MIAIFIAVLPYAFWRRWCGQHAVRAAYSGSYERVVPQDRVHAERLVRDLRHSEIDHDRREGERIIAGGLVLARHEVEHPVQRDARGLTQVLVEPEGEPGVPDARGRLLERYVIANAQRDLRVDRRLDRGARDFTVALLRCSRGSV
jgi:hypothetical protein